ncbi:MAG TPA: SIR2 family protein [Gaiellaceae bacterium]
MSAYTVSPDELFGTLGWLRDPREPEAHLEVLSRSEFVVPVVGSGINAGYPAGAALANELRRLGQEAGLDGDELEKLRDPRSIADELIGKRIINRDALLRHVGEIYSAAPTETNPTLDALLDVRSRRVVTLNYDRSLEARADELKVDVDSLVLSADGARALAALEADADRDKLVVVHAHGIATAPSTIVLDGEGYSSLENAPFFRDWLLTLVVSSRLLFMGTSLDEQHILHELMRLGLLHRRHMLVGTHGTIEALRASDRGALVPERYGVLLRGYDDHDAVLELVERLGRTAETETVVPPGGASPLPVVSTRPPSSYVPTLMVEPHTAEDNFRASYLVTLGLHPPIEIEQLVALGTRTLIEGLPGSGKSTLLLEIGSRQPGQVVPVLIRATDLDLVGDPRLLLTRWLKASQAFREGETLDIARLEGEIFHFLIDGLDEVPNASQGQAASQIVGVAEAHPNHAFTVASRAVPATEAFASAEWLRVVLEPGGTWRQAYLEKRGVSWEELVGAAPLLADLRGLLDLPFFLSQTVDLYEDGAISSSGDLLDLVSRFVDAALTDLGETLPAEAVRKWLRQLALALLLAGRIDISLDEIAASLPGELRSFGDETAIAERLATAMLLRATGNARYAFVHRIFGEALAAEALLELEPHASGVLDVAAPAVTARIRGLRSDWLVPMTLAAFRSEDWRAALAERDALAAARATPLDAPIERRLEAARLIWRIYVEWRIWISDYRRMSIVEDEEVLARLLNTEGLGELQAEIRTAISRGSRETIGNAIRVLATAGDGAIEPLLREVLESNDDYVLRRTAAIAARDLRLDTLFYVIAHRALHPEEETEAQDLTYAALDLAGPDDLASLALRAARKGGTAIGILAHAIQGRVSPRQELEVLRIWSERRAEPLINERSRLLELLHELPLDDNTVAESVIFIAGSWRLLDEEFAELVSSQPDAAIRAALALDKSKSAYIYELRWILENIDRDRLAEAGASEEMLRDKDMLEEWKRRRDE